MAQSHVQHLGEKLRPEEEPNSKAAGEGTWWCQCRETALLRPGPQEKQGRGWPLSKLGDGVVLCVPVACISERDLSASEVEENKAVRSCQAGGRGSGGWAWASGGGAAHGEEGDHGLLQGRGSEPEPRELWGGP